LKDLEALSLEESERIAREAFDSGWKDDLRSTLRPLDEALQHGEPIEGPLINLLLVEVIADLVASRATHPVSHYSLFRQIKRLEQRLEKLEAQRG